MNANQREGQSGNWWSYMGYSCTFQGISYQCPALKLSGYANDLQLHRAIKRTVKARELRPQPREVTP